MNRKIPTIIALIACGTGLYFWWFSDSKVITRSTESLIECFEKDADDGRFSGAIATSTFRDLLDDNISLKIKRRDIPYLSTSGSRLKKGDLVQMLSALSQSSAIIKITDKKITISEIKDIQASVNINLNISTEKLPKNISSGMNCELTYRKIDGDWKVSKVIVK